MHPIPNENEIHSGQTPYQGLGLAAETPPAPIPAPDIARQEDWLAAETPPAPIPAPDIARQEDWLAAETPPAPIPAPDIASEATTLGALGTIAANLDSRFNVMMTNPNSDAGSSLDSDELALAGRPSDEARVRLNDLLTQNTPHHPLLGKRVIARSNWGGCWWGVLASKSDNSVRLEHARRMWRWWAAEGVSLSGVAVAGLHPDKIATCTIEPVVDVVVVEGVCELLAASRRASASIAAAPVVSADGYGCG